MTPQRLVTLLELLRTYTEVFQYSSYRLGGQVESAFRNKLTNKDCEHICRHLKNLYEECHRLGLEMSALLLSETIQQLENSQSPPEFFHEVLDNICNELRRELSLQLFFRIKPEHRTFFDQPLHKWEEIVRRFDRVAEDVEEMHKCFALSRYTAAMFHAMQIAEAGAIELGEYIGVSDPKKGWGPTSRRLGKLIGDGRDKLPNNLSGQFDFLEQMNREIDSMVLAWRHKVDHAANRLAILPNATFTPDISEHVMGAVRVFMLRLSEGLPALNLGKTYD